MTGVQTCALPIFIALTLDGPTLDGFGIDRGQHIERPAGSYPLQRARHVAYNVIESNAGKLLDGKYPAVTPGQ